MVARLYVDRFSNGMVPMRKSNAWYATREARAEWELRDRFEELAEAAMALRETGDFDRLEIALDALSLDPEYHGFPPLNDKMTRDERVAALAARYVSIGQFLGRMKHTAERIDQARRLIGEEIRLASIEPDSVPEYVKTFWKRLAAEGIGQKDLHPGSRNLARAVAHAIRDYNDQRRLADRNEASELYDDTPVGSWIQLPRLFAGFELIDVDPEDAKDLDPCALPPSTDMADFTVDRRRPPFGRDRAETYKAWGGLIEDWASRTGKKMARSESYIWAFLLAHRLPADQSDAKYFDGRELRSPWRDGGVVRIVQLSSEERQRLANNGSQLPHVGKGLHSSGDDDDVPY